MVENLKIIMAIIKAIDISKNDTVTINGEVQSFPVQKGYKDWTYPAKQFGTNEGGKKQDNSFTELLMQRIYAKFYSTGHVLNSAEEPKPYLIPGFKARQVAFMNKIALSIKTTVSGDPFWKIIDINEGVAYISKNGIQLPLVSGTYRLHQPSQPFEVGRYVHLYKPISDRSIQDFFFYILGNKVLRDELDIIRFYFNMDPDYVHLLIDSITTILNQYEVPFTFKCLNETGMYTRVDNCVLYTDMRYHSILEQLIPLIYLPIAQYTNDGTPLFTLKLAPGLAFAEDPGAGQSFGQNRCRILSNILLEAKKNNQILTPAIVEKGFEDLGLDIQKLYLKPYSVMQYNFPISTN